MNRCLSIILVASTNYCPSFSLNYCMSFTLSSIKFRYSQCSVLGTFLISWYLSYFSHWHMHICIFISSLKPAVASCLCSTSQLASFLWRPVELSHNVKSFLYTNSRTLNRNCPPIGSHTEQMLWESVDLLRFLA